jgi:hypothetical protein
MPVVYGLGAALFISIGLQLINPLIMRSFIDLARAGGAVSELTRMALTFIGIAVGQQLIGVLVTFITEIWAGPPPTRSAWNWRVIRWAWICRFTPPVPQVK